MQRLVYIQMYVNQRLQIQQIELLMMSGMPLETCSAFNKRWNNKFYYKVVTIWNSKLYLQPLVYVHIYVNQTLQIQFRAPDDERYAARNMLSLQ